MVSGASVAMGRVKGMCGSMVVVLPIGERRG